MPEISDADYAQQQALLKLFDQVCNDPNVGQNVRRRAKELRPEINIPDDHPVAKEARTKIEGLETQVNSLQTMLTGCLVFGQHGLQTIYLRFQTFDFGPRLSGNRDGRPGC